MKRIWFAIVFLTICIVLCVFEQGYIKNVHHGLNSKIVAAEKEPNKENISEIKKYWKKTNFLLNTLCDSSTLNELNSEIIYLDMEDENIGASLAKVRCINDSYYQAQKLNFANIF